MGGKKNQNKSSQLVLGPLHTEKKNWNSERWANILSYMWDIYNEIPYVEL